MAGPRIPEQLRIWCESQHPDSKDSATRKEAFRVTVIRIPTIGLLESSLQQDLSWRRKELSDLYLSAVAAPDRSEAQTRAIRSGIVLSYAHLEGFTKQAGRFYFAYVKSRKLAYAELAQSFLAVKLSRMISEATTKASYYAVAVSLLTTDFSQSAQLPEPEVIDTQSNLNFARFTEILYCLNIDAAPFSMKANFFDEVLLARRNAIAHGEFRKPQLSDYVEIHNGVIEILQKLHDTFVDSANSQKFTSIGWPIQYLPAQ